MNRTTRTAAPISHFGGNVKPFSEKSFLIIEAQNERDVKRFFEKISAVAESWAELEERDAKLTEAYFDTIVKAFLGNYSLELVPELIDGYLDWSEEAEQLRAEYEKEAEAILISYNARFVKGFSEIFFSSEVSG